MTHESKNKRLMSDNFFFFCKRMNENESKCTLIECFWLFVISVQTSIQPTELPVSLRKRKKTENSTKSNRNEARKIRTEFTALPMKTYIKYMFSSAKYHVYIDVTHPLSFYVFVKCFHCLSFD